MSLGLKRSCLLLIFGVLFPSITGCVSSVPRSRTARMPELKIYQQSVQLVPSVSGSITQIRFFESGRSEIELRRKKVYQNRFAQATTRTIYTEIRLEHPQVQGQIEFPITLVVNRADGTTFRIEKYTARLKEGWSNSDHWIGVGYHRPGKWDAGIYNVDVYIKGNKVATSHFEIY
jgi:hypothetical protein